MKYKTPILLIILIMTLSFVSADGIGDLNNDNRVDSSDSDIVVRWILNIDRTTSADVNGDGEVNIIDVMIVFSLKGITYVTSTECPTSIPSGTFKGCYYDGLGFNSFKFSKQDSEINFDWGTGTPSTMLGVDTFSIKWEGDFTFESGTYNFSTTIDDGVRVYVDNVLVIDQWKDQGATTYVSQRSITSGVHRVKMEYYESGGQAVAKLLWIKQATSTQSNTTTQPPVVS